MAKRPAGIPACYKVGCEKYDRHKHVGPVESNERVVVTPKLDTAPGWAYTNPHGRLVGYDGEHAIVALDDGETKRVQPKNVVRERLWKEPRLDRRIPPPSASPTQAVAGRAVAGAAVVRPGADGTRCDVSAVSTAQRYRPGIAHERMADGNCPECGRVPDEHAQHGNFWDPWFQACDLRRLGVIERIEQYRKDVDVKPEGGSLSFGGSEVKPRAPRKLPSGETAHV